jgi:hypothetical protein
MMRYVIYLEWSTRTVLKRRLRVLCSLGDTRSCDARGDEERAMVAWKVLRSAPRTPIRLEGGIFEECVYM